MPDVDEKFILVRNAVIEQGIEGVKSDDTFHGATHKREGSIAGFQLCRQLNTLQEFEEKINKRQIEEANWRREGPRPEDYWFFRCATTQIEFCYEVMKVFVGRSTHYSARATVCYHKIVEELKKEGKL